MWSFLFRPSDNRTRPCHRHRRLDKQRYYYTDSNLFEQSLDVYKPVHNDNADDSDDCNNPGLLVVLVVGSAWLGHVPPIYTATSWWNASGPQAVAQQVGCVTVAIRHRGSFPRIRELVSSNWSCLGWLVSVVVGVMMSALLLQSPSFSSMSLDDSLNAMMELQKSTSPISFALLVLALLLLLVVVLVLIWGEVQGPPADLEDMLQDVADALQWIERHKKNGSSDVLSLSKATTTDDESSSSSEKQQQSRRPLVTTTTTVFGGYSSGGHVAATLLQRPDILTSRGLSLPGSQDAANGNQQNGSFCQAVLFLSGVLAVRPLVADDSQSPSHSSQSQSHSSRWFTDLVTHVVFGPTRAPHLPCPLHNLLLQLRNNNNKESRNGCENSNHNKSKNTLNDDSGLDYYPRNLPHLLIGCQDEVFGLGWMNVFFSSAEYCQVLQEQYSGIVPAAKWVAVTSNHWNILNSTALRQVLSPQLKWLVGQVQENKNINNGANEKMKQTPDNDDNSSDITRSSSSSSSSSDDSDDKDDTPTTTNRSILTLTTTTTSQSSSSSNSSKDSQS